MWIVRAAGPAAGMIVPRMAIVAVAVIGMFVAVIMLVLMSRRPGRYRATGSAPGRGTTARAPGHLPLR